MTLLYKQPSQTVKVTVLHLARVACPTFSDAWTCRLINQRMYACARHFLLTCRYFNVIPWWDRFRRAKAVAIPGYISCNYDDDDCDLSMLSLVLNLKLLNVCYVFRATTIWKLISLWLHCI